MRASHTAFDYQPRGDAETAHFYRTVIKTFESPALFRQARERVNALHPELEKSDVEIRAVRTNGSSIFNILATGNEPKYTKIFLDALVDEFLAFRHSIYQQSQGAVIAPGMKDLASKYKAVTPDYLNLQERASTATEYVNDWKLPVLVGGVLGALAGLIVGLLISFFIRRVGKAKLPQTV